MFDDLFGKRKKEKIVEGVYCMLIKDEGFSKWFQCQSCSMQFEADASGMNTKLVTGTGPTGRGRHLEPACPKCEPNPKPLIFKRPKLRIVK